MSLKPFRFKQFSVKHDKCAMKVGTDAVLLGAWMNLREAKTILEIGTGSGVIALIAAQRTNESTHIDAVEIEEVDTMQAMENIRQSPWPKKIRVHQTPIQQFENNFKYDFIFSNPPYFNKSLLPPSQGRSRVRHTQTLSYEDLISNSIRLLESNGKLAVILPYAEGNHFKEIANQKGLYLIRQCAFYSRKEKPQERWLMEFSLTKSELRQETLVLYNSDNNKSREYAELTENYYL